MFRCPTFRSRLLTGVLIQTVVFGTLGAASVHAEDEDSAFSFKAKSAEPKEPEPEPEDT